MIPIGNFFFKYRNLLFPLFGLIIFIPSPKLFTHDTFGKNHYAIPLILGLTIAIFGQVIRAATIGLKYIKRGGLDKKVYASDLVTDGIFNHCRNPLYSGNILMLSGIGILSNSLLFVLLVVPLFIFIYQCIVLAEENYLRNKFGQQFELYCNHVNRWIPRLKGISSTFRNAKFNWNRYIANEYNTIYLLFLSIYIVLLVFNPAFIGFDPSYKFTVSVVVLFILTSAYSFVRYLKKSKKIKLSRTNQG